MTDEERLAEARRIRETWLRKCALARRPDADGSMFLDETIAAALVERDAEIERLRQWRDDFIYHAVEWRGVDITDICPECSGAGTKAYSDTSTWRRGIGGQTITTDVCNKCWGSGSKAMPWRSWRNHDEIRALSDDSPTQEPPR